MRVLLDEWHGRRRHSDREASRSSHTTSGNFNPRLPENVAFRCETSCSDSRSLGQCYRRVSFPSLAK